MKNAIFIVVPLFTFNMLIAQTSYEGQIKKLVEKRVKQYPLETENVGHAYAVLSYFDKAKKPEQAAYQKKNVGIAIVLSDIDLDSPPTLAPAAYNYEDSKIGIAAVRNPENKGSNPKLDNFTTSYIYDFERIFSDPVMQFLIKNDVPAEGNVTSNSKELIVNEAETLSFIRSDTDWMYIISIDSDFEQLTTPRIILYAYRITLTGNDIFHDSKNPEKLTVVSNEKAIKKENKKRLYHDYATNDLIGYVKYISTQKPYSEDKELLKNLNELPSKLDRDNVGSYQETLLYFANTFELTPEDEAKYKDSFGSTRELVNIVHLATHALADIFMTEGDYTQAIEYFSKAQNDHPYLQSSGTTMNKDYLRIQNDLAEAYNESDQKDLAIAHVLNMLMNRQYSDKYVNKKLLEYTENEDESLLKKDIDAIASTIRSSENYEYTYVYTFRNKQISFTPYFGSGESEYKHILESDFYKTLRPKDETQVTTDAATNEERTGISSKTFFHGNELDDLEQSLSKLKQTEQFKSDAKFTAHLASFQEKLKQKKSFDFSEELKYFYLYTYVTSDMVKNMTEQEGIDLMNIKHVAGHLLSDYHIKSKKPTEALSYLLLLETNFKLAKTGLENTGEDRQQIRSDLSDVYLSIENEEAALSYLLAIFLDGGHLAKYADTKMESLAKSIDADELKTFMEQFFDTLEMSDSTHYNFRMGYFYPKLELAKPTDKASLKERVKKAKFFKML